MQQQEKTQREKDQEFELEFTIRGQFCHDWTKTLQLFMFLMSVVLAGIPVAATGIWTIVQCTMFFPIITQVSISLIIIAALLIVMGVLLILVIVGFLLFVICERPSIKSERRLGQLIGMFAIFLIILEIVSAVLGIIAAGALIPSLSDRIESSANTSFFTIRDSLEARDAWDIAQNTLRCCGAVNFSDYQQIFNNFSVPVSCCNTTNPLVNETTCQDIVMDTNMIDTELIYTEGCIPELMSYFYYVHKVIGNGVIIEAIPIGILATISVFIWFIRADLWAEPKTEQNDKN